MITNYPTQVELEEVFELRIDERNGHETLWRKFLSTNQFGKKGEWFKVKCKANCGMGYCQVGFKGRLVSYHTIVWTIINGDIPEDLMIDHISGDKVDNQLSNLRLSTHRQNGGNRIEHREGKLCGCSYRNRYNKWQAHIEINGMLIYLGYYQTEEEANQAYLKADKMRIDGFSPNFIRKMLRIKTKDCCTSKYRGVNWNKQNKKWMVQITIEGKLSYLGYYDSEEEASTVYLKARGLIDQFVDRKQFRELLL